MSISKKTVSVSLNQVNALTSTEHGLVIHRQKIAQCCVVGIVTKINEQSTKTTYTLNDYTGPLIEVSSWKKAQDGESTTHQQVDRAVIMEQTYVKVFGQPRKDANGGPHFVAFHIQPLENLNELTIHLVEVACHSKDLAMLKNGYLMKADCGTNLNGNQQLIGSKNAVPKVAGFNEIQSLVLNIIKRDSTEIGIGLDDIKQSLRTSKPEVIKEAVDFLLNEGHIYEALDEYHFKSSD